MTLYYFLLSGEHPTLPLAELEALLDVYGGRIHGVLEGAAIAEARDPQAIVSRAGWVKEAGRLVAVVEAEESEISRILRGLRGRVEVRKFRGYSCHVDGRLRAGAPGDEVIRVFITEGVAVVGVVLARQDTRGFHERRPGRRPFFKPGPLSPQLSRVLVNLSRLSPGDLFLDPFCGTGGFALEACLSGARACLCSDIAPEMARGSTVNLAHYGVYGRSVVLRADAARLPLRDGSVDALSTDPPYGRSTTTAKRSYEELVGLFLREAYRVLRPGSCVVYAGPAVRKPWRLAEEAGFEVAERHQMYVHSSLTREVVVAAKPGGRRRCRTLYSWR